MNYILYLAYRRQNIISEVIYSILSYLHRVPEGINEHLKIIIYTDQIDSFQNALPTVDHIIYEFISNSTLDDWLGPACDPFRPKIKVLQNFFSKYEGNVLFVDSDSFFLKDIQPLFEQISQRHFILHLEEKSLEKEYTLSYTNDFFRYLKQHNKISTKLKTYKIPPNTQCWNSGVVGLNSVDAYLLEEILSLTDFINETFEFEYGEQFSFSYILQNNGVVHGCDDFIFHYWFYKPCRFLLAEYLKYFHGNDQNELAAFLEQNNIDKLKYAQFQKLLRNEIKYEELLPLVFTFLIMKSNPNPVYWNLPENSFVGKALRDKKSFMKYIRLLLPLQA